MLHHLPSAAVATCLLTAIGALPSPASEVGQFVAGKDDFGILLQRPSDKDEWKRVPADAPVHAESQLLSLPGSSCEVQLATGVHLTLWAHVPEFSHTSVMDALSETAVTINEPKGGLEADIALDRGRIRLCNGNAKGTVRIRLRFPGKTWDIGLQPGQEAVVVLLHRRSSPIVLGEQRRLFYEVALYQSQGEMGVSEDEGMHGSISVHTPGALIQNSAGAMDLEAGNEAVLIWMKPRPETPAAAAAARALRKLSDRLTDKASVEACLREGAISDDADDQRLAVRCLGALGDMPAVLDALGEGGEAHGPARRAAIAALGHWIRAGLDRDLRLYDPKTDKGLLMRLQSVTDAELALKTLTGFSDDARYDPRLYESLTEDLRASHIETRELAYWQLLHFAAGMKLPEYNAAWPRNRLDRAAEEWGKLVEGGQLPPRSEP